MIEVDFRLFVAILNVGTIPESSMSLSTLALSDTRRRGNHIRDGRCTCSIPKVWSHCRNFNVWRHSLIDDDLGDAYYHRVQIRTPDSGSVSRNDKNYPGQHLSYLEPSFPNFANEFRNTSPRYASPM